jgi:hypothetical protein
LYAAVEDTDTLVYFYIGFETAGWYYLFSRWFPSNGYELVENAHFFRVVDGGSRYELWVLVKKSDEVLNNDKRKAKD